MLLSSPVGCPPALLSGLGQLPTVSIPLQKLQAQLYKLSQATRNPAIDPKEYAGVLISGLPSDQTMAAVAASIGLVGPKLSSFKRAALMVALGVGASTDTAKRAVLNYADELRQAALAATIAAPYYVKDEAAPTEDPGFATTGPWYKTWWGIGAIAVGVLGVVSLLAARRAPALPRETRKAA